MINTPKNQLLRDQCKIKNRASKSAVQREKKRYHKMKLYKFQWTLKEIALITCLKQFVLL